jgi:hypothetical protein
MDMLPTEAIQRPRSPLSERVGSGPMTTREGVIRIFDPMVNREGPKEPSGLEIQPVLLRF